MIKIPHTTTISTVSHKFYLHDSRFFVDNYFSEARSGCFVCLWKPLEFNLFYMILLIHLDILKILFLIMLWKWFIHNTHVHGILNVSSGWLSVKISSFLNIMLAIWIRVWFDAGDLFFTKLCTTVNLLRKLNTIDLIYIINYLEININNALCWMSL